MRMIYIVNGYTSQYSFIQRRNDFFVIFNRSNTNTSQRAAIFFGNSDVIGNINQTTGQVTGICRFQSRIRQTFTGTMGRDKILQYRQTFFKVSQNRVFNNLSSGST